MLNGHKVLMRRSKGNSSDAKHFDSIGRMRPLPWKTLTAPDSSREYLALLSFLPVKHYGTIPKFFWLTLQTQRQLHKSTGLIGYSLHAEPLRRQFWTLSVWEDYESLMNFVHQAPHGKIVQALAPHMGKTLFVHWKLTGKDIPPGWNEARARLS